MTKSWRWATIAAATGAVRALRNEQNRVVALWASGADVVEGTRRLLMLEFLEIDPDLRGGLVGAFVLALIAARARDAGYDGVLMHSLPETAKVYTRAGITQRVVQAHPPDGELVSFVIEGTNFEELGGAADAFKNDEGNGH